ncbi:MAG: hypothetical protein AAFW01_10060 [Pseudomonadota bacterium]
MTTPIILEFEVEPRLLARGVIAGMRRWSGLCKRSTYWRNFFLTALTTVALISFGQVLHPDVGRGYVLGLFVGSVVVWFLLSGLQRRNAEEIYGAAIAAKDIDTLLRVELDHNGVHCTSSDSTSSVRWSAVNAVHEIEGGIALGVGLAVVPIPDTALPSGMDREALVAKIRQLGAIE